MPTVVVDGETGVLVPAEDVDLLAEGIISLLRDPAVRARFGAAAKRRVELEYSATRMTDDYLRVYSEAIRGADQGRDIPLESSAASGGKAK